MYISEHYLEEMFDMKSAKEFYKYYPKKEFEKNFEGIKKLYNDGKYRLLAKQLGILLFGYPLKIINRMKLLPKVQKIIMGMIYKFEEM